MSISNGFFTNDDGEIIKLSYVVSVEPSVGANGYTNYEVNIVGGTHISIKQSYFDRASFIAQWQAS